MKDKTNIIYVYNGIKLFESKTTINNLKNSKISLIFKSYITRQFKLSIPKYLEDLGFNMLRCNFCGDYAFFDIFFKILENNKNDNSYTITIEDIKFPQCNYCRNANKKCDGPKYNPNSIKFVSTIYNLSDDEALKLIKKRNKSCFYKENFKTEEEYKKSQTRDLEFYTKKHGEVKGTEEFEKYLKKLKYTHSEQYYIDKLGEEEGKKHWSKLSELKDCTSYKAILRLANGDIDKAAEMYENRINTIKNQLKRTYLKYGGDNLKGFGGGVSKESIEFFDKLTNILIELNIINDSNETKYGLKNEKAIYNEISGTCYFYDYYIPKYSILIEYNGIAFHPKSHDDENFRHVFIRNKTTEQLYNNDMHKINTAKKYNYNIIIIWSDDKDKINTALNEIKNIIHYEKK